MLRAILGVVVGTVVALACVAGVEMLGHLAFPPPPGIDLADPAQMKTIIEQIPFPAKAAVLVAWFIGAFAGASVAILIGERRALTGWTVALLILASGVATMFQIPHPVWMIVGGVALPILGGWLAARLWARPVSK